MFESQPQKRDAARILSDEINDIRLQLAKAVNVLDDVATKYFGQGVTPEGWALANEYHRFGTKIEIVADYLWNVEDRLNQLNAASDQDTTTHDDQGGK